MPPEPPPPLFEPPLAAGPAPWPPLLPSGVALFEEQAFTPNATARRTT